MAAVMVAAGVEASGRGDGRRGRRRAAGGGRRSGPRCGPCWRLDIDEQRSTPLTLLRGAVRYPTEVLRRAGVEPTGERDDVRVRLFPDDVYDLSPAAFADVDPRLTEPGLVWGAAKAYEHLRRHKPEKEDV